jgi:hypothetical protein
VKHGLGEHCVVRQNVTISLPSDLLREAKHLAVEQGVSLSRFVAMLLDQRVRTALEYRGACDRQLALLRRGLPLCTGGRINWTREHLHDPEFEA